MVISSRVALQTVAEHCLPFEHNAVGIKVLAGNGVVPFSECFRWLGVVGVRMQMPMLILDERPPSHARRCGLPHDHLTDMSTAVSTISLLHNTWRGYFHLAYLFTAQWFRLGWWWKGSRSSHSDLCVSRFFDFRLLLSLRRTSSTRDNLFWNGKYGNRWRTCSICL